MAKSNFVDPPQEVQEQLQERLSIRYKELEGKLSEGVFRNISYESGEHPVRYTATVSYHFNGGSLIALFSYQENKEKREFYWCCTNDWND